MPSTTWPYKYVTDTANQKQINQKINKIIRPFKQMYSYSKFNVEFKYLITFYTFLVTKNNKRHLQKCFRFQSIRIATN